MSMLSSIFFAQAQPPAPPPLQPLPHPELPTVVLPAPELPLWIYIAGALLVVALLGLVLWLLLRPRKPTPVMPKKPWSIAREALLKIMAAANEQPPGETASQVSEVLRRYFFDRYKIPAPFRTTREIFQGDGIPATSLRLHRYASLAELWDQLAFAPLPSSGPEAKALVGKALEYLEEDRP